MIFDIYSHKSDIYFLLAKINLVIYINSAFLKQRKAEFIYGKKQMKGREKL
jgi:hypothetical protein